MMKHSGHTLIELVLSVSILGILMTAMVSAVAIASRSVPSTSSAEAAAAVAADALDQMTDEGRYAVYLTSPLPGGGRRLSFTLADRDGDGGPERVVYEWSGVAGEPLTRRYNGAAAQTVAPGVRLFEVTPVTRVVTETYHGPVIPDPDGEKTVSSYASTPTATEHYLSKTNWIGQRFTPQNVPARAVGWEPREVSLKSAARIQLLLDLVAESAHPRIYAATSNGLPAGSVLASGSILETLLPTGTPTSNPIPFTTTQVLPVDQTYALVVGWGGLLAGNVAMRLEQESSATVGASGLLKSTSGESNWSLDANRALVHQIRGRYWVRKADQYLDRTYVSSIGVTLACGPAEAPTQTGTITPANTPEVLTASWQADFEIDPTRLDSNGDGNPDWVAQSGPTIALTDLVGGLLKWQGTLTSRPLNNFTEPTTIEARLRATSSTPTELRINAESSGGQAAPLILKVHRVLGTQTVELLNTTSALSTVSLKKVEGLSNDYMRVRLLIDPARDTVNLAIDGGYIGTYTYSRYGLLLVDDRCVSLVSNSGSQWDWLDVRVGGAAR